MSKKVTIYPVKGKFIPGRPAVEQKVDPAEARTLVSSGAFTLQPPAAQDQAKPSKDK
jgi:hypothetical protein